MMAVMLTRRPIHNPAPGQYHYPKLHDAKAIGKTLRADTLIAAHNPKGLQKLIDTDRDIIGYEFDVPDTDDARSHLIGLLSSLDQGDLFAITLAHNATVSQSLYPPLPAARPAPQFNP